MSFAFLVRNYIWIHKDNFIPKHSLTVVNILRNWSFILDFAFNLIQKQTNALNIIKVWIWTRQNFELNKYPYGDSLINWYWYYNPYKQWEQNHCLFPHKFGVVSAFTPLVKCPFCFHKLKWFNSDSLRA